MSAPTAVDYTPTPSRIARHGPPFVLVAGIAFLLGRRFGTELAVAAALAAGFTWLVIPYWGRYLRRRRIVVRPGGRSGHRGAVACCGGLVLFVPFAAATAVLALSGEMKMVGLLGGATLMLAVGFLDDLRGLSPPLKILAQLVAGTGLLCTGYSLSPLGLPGAGPVELGAAEGPLLLFWVVLATNAFNIIDGMDGLAAGVGVVAAAGLVYLGVHPVASAMLAMGLMGFLPHNLPRARIFLGDAGTMFVGFVLAALLLEVPHSSNVAIVAALYAYPLGDVGLASLRRFVRGKPLFCGDRSHIHHKLASHMRSDRLAVFTVHGMAAVVAVVGLYFRDGFFVVGLLLAWAGLAALLVHLGRVHIGRMIGNRRPFQELHVLRRYVEGRIRLARTPADVRRALKRLVEDLNLVALHMGDLHIENGGGDDPNRQDQRVKLPLGWGEWSLVPNGLEEEPAFVAEREAVVCDLIREADRRLQANGG